MTLYTLNMFDKYNLISQCIMRVSLFNNTREHVYVSCERYSTQFVNIRYLVHLILYKDQCLIKTTLSDVNYSYSLFIASFVCLVGVLDSGKSLYERSVVSSNPIKCHQCFIDQEIRIAYDLLVPGTDSSMSSQSSSNKLITDLPRKVKTQTKPNCEICGILKHARYIH